MVIPMGMTYKIKPTSDGSGVHWSLKRHSTEILNGFAKDEKTARKVIGAAIMEYLAEEGPKMDRKARARQTIRYYMDRRPYLVSAVVGSLVSGNFLKDILSQAEELEKMIWESEPPKIRVPLSTHHRSKPARAAAEHIVECLRILGLMGEDTPSSKLGAWAKSMGITRQEI